MKHALAALTATALLAIPASAAADSASGSQGPAGSDGCKAPRTTTLVRHYKTHTVTTIRIVTFKCVTRNR